MTLLACGWPSSVGVSKRVRKVDFLAIDLDCSTCHSDERVVLVERLSGTQRKLKCEQCGREWLRGEPVRQKIPLPMLKDIKKRFPQPGDVDPQKLARANELKVEFLKRDPEPDPNVAPYWAKYQQVFSVKACRERILRIFKDFANSNIGANPGNMSVFNDAWNAMGPEAGAHQVRKVVEYLLRGTSPVDIEDRLTALISDSKSFGMKGFKESLLTKVLCIVYPDRYLTILKYTGRLESERLHTRFGASNCLIHRPSIGRLAAAFCGATTCSLHFSARASGTSCTLQNSYGGPKIKLD